MNGVSGRIVVKETGAGIPDLVVAVFDLDPHSSPEEKFESVPVDSGPEKWRKIAGNRLGSVLTRADGTFLLEYDENAFRTGDEEKRPDLTLMVTAPEEPTREHTPPIILYASNGVRQNAGRNEAYFVRLPAAVLKDIGISMSNGASHRSAEATIRRAEEDEARRKKIAKGLRSVNETRIEEARVLTRKVKEQFSNFNEAVLSRVPPEHRDLDTYVRPGKSVEKATEDVIRRNIQAKNKIEDPRNKATVRLSLTQQEVEDLRLKDAAGEPRADPLSADEVKKLDAILHGEETGGSRPVVLERLSPIELACRPKEPPADPCAQHTAHVHPNGNPVTPLHPPTAPPPFVKEGDEIAYLARLLGDMFSQEATLILNSCERPLPGERDGLDAVQRSVDKLELRGGLADTTAYYDFHNLQIAFEHVWQEAFDHGVAGTAKTIFKRIVKEGGRPRAPQNDDTAQSYCQSLRDEIEALESAREDKPPPHEVVAAFGIIPDEWNALTELQQQELQYVTGKLNENVPVIHEHMQPKVLGGGFFTDETIRLEIDITNREDAIYRTWGENIIAYAKRQLDDPGSAPGLGFTSAPPLSKLIADLEKRLSEPNHSFTHYAADSNGSGVNFGLLITYRQKWEPLGYQAGKLVKSIPLAPKEVRKYTKKETVKKSRAQKEVENNLQSSKSDTSDTSRAESEIVRNAQNKSNFNMSAQGGIQAKVLSFSGSTAYGSEASSTSNDVKKEFREAIFKAAEEYKTDHTVEINTAESFDTEAEESGELINPNDEISVTYLFYELQRRYRMNEQIQRLTPVVLVAQEVPSPNEIDEDWLVAHDWILRRVMLDDSFLPALTYVSTNMVGDRFALEELRKNLLQQRRLLAKLEAEVILVRAQTKDRYDELIEATKERAFQANREGSGSGDADEKARILEESAKSAYEQAARFEKDLRDRIEREVTALGAGTEAYSKALAEHLNGRAQVARLRVHVKQNILYYMQAIWSHEPPDQRFFRLHTVKVPDLKEQAAGRSYSLVADSGVAPVASGLPHLGDLPYAFLLNAVFDPDFAFDALAEVADIDNLLGYKGNYMIFPLRKDNDLTRFMKTPYIDRVTVLHDPDEAGNWTLADFAKYVCCLKENSSPAEFEALKPRIKEEYDRLRISLGNRPVDDEIVVPTGSLFIEALPGSHPILEDFKLQHRAIDVKKVQAEVRHAELENVRLAARLLAKEREDPDIEKKIVIEGQGENIIVPPVDD
jgi:hypothetical protein